MKEQNRIWIELDIQKQYLRGSREHNQKQCELANKMLGKLKKTGPEEQFFMLDNSLHFGGNFGFHVCIDNGKWFTEWVYQCASHSRAIGISKYQWIE